MICAMVAIILCHLTEAVHLGQPVPKGILLNTIVYSCLSQDSATLGRVQASHLRTVDVASVSLAAAQAITTYKLPIAVSWTGSLQAPLRWSMNREHFLVAEFWPLQDELPGRGGVIRSIAVSALPRFVPTNGSPDWKLQGDLLRRGVPLSPYDYELLESRTVASLQHRRAGFSFVVSKDGIVSLYILSGKRMTLWKRSGLQGEWKRVSSFEAPWLGAFDVIESRSDHFFVTAGGKVYGIDREKGGAGKLAELWSGKPVAAIFVDANLDELYCFTRKTYFRVERTVKPQEHHVQMSFPCSNESSIRMLAECGRVIEKSSRKK
jgi:hypothetical protein